MGEAYFYHLTRRTLDVVLPQLLGRALGQGWQVLVRGRDPGRMEQIDEALWTFADDSFLPHGLAGGDHDALQPILLAGQDTDPGARGCVMSVDGAPVTAEEVARLERVCVIFDGRDPAALDHARAQWRDLTKAGVRARYWSEEGGTWEMKADG